ncbi:MAG: hypothetical protein LC798_19145 [Chloroflexi bacterium]|nr:hypothetical protein [Chloroflexota bacterium]
MPMNLKKEGAAIRALLDQADGMELSAEVALEKAQMDADEMRWEAARRCTEAFESSGMKQTPFAKAVGLDGRRVSQMRRVWQEWLGEPGRPRYYDAVEMQNDRHIVERAQKVGRSITSQAWAERKGITAMKEPVTAQAVMRNPIARQTARHAIVAAEAEEARERLMANAQPVDLPVSVNGFNWLDADATLSHARKLINSVARMVREHAPLSERDREMVADGIQEARISLEILETVVNAGDLDEALARLLEEA